MWTRTYLLLLAVRTYFALAPSYIHPDENFQGPEVIAGMFSAHSLPSLRLPEAQKCGNGPRKSGERPDSSASWRA